MWVFELFKQSYIERYVARAVARSALIGMGGGVQCVILIYLAELVKKIKIEQAVQPTAYCNTGHELVVKT